MAEREALTAEYVRQILDYDPDTGEFRWKARPVDHFQDERARKIWNTRFVGTIAGSHNSHGYLMIRIDGRLHMAHRLAWLYVTNEWPKDQIDHINLVRNDNHWVNLREATRSQNKANMRRISTNTSGMKGVCLHRPSGKWLASIKKNQKRHHLGYFDCIEEAASAYEQAARDFYGEFARTI